MNWLKKLWKRETPNYLLANESVGIPFMIGPSDQDKPFEVSFSGITVKLYRGESLYTMPDGTYIIKKDKKGEGKT